MKTSTERELTLYEFKRLLDGQMALMRKRKRITENIEMLYDYIEVLVQKDIYSRDRFRVGTREYYVLWESALNEK